MNDTHYTVFYIETPVGETRIKLGGKTAQFVYAQPADMISFLYRGRRYAGEVLLTNPAYETSDDRATDYRPPYNYGYKLTKPGGGPVAQATYQKIGEAIALALKAHLALNPDLLDDAERASRAGQAAALAERIEGLTAQLDEMRKEYERLTTGT
jgi:hypothetical protein